jgi:putative transposase
MPASDAQLVKVAKHFIDEFELRNTRPLDTDLLALFMDAKYVEVREGDHLRPCCLYVAVGLGREGRRRVLACHALPGRESIENWKAFLRSLLERGLRNVLIVVQDDFPGLLTVNKGLFPGADTQLCIVHMQRNAKSHLGKAGGAEFNARMRTIKTAWNPELAASQFDDLCRDFEKASPAFVAELRKKREHYLVFLHYPDTLRRSFSTTNAVEAINGQLEIMRRNNGGYFHGTDNLKARVGIALDRLENRRGRRERSPSPPPWPSSRPCSSPASNPRTDLRQRAVRLPRRRRPGPDSAHPLAPDPSSTIPPASTPAARRSTPAPAAPRPARPPRSTELTPETQRLRGVPSGRQATRCPSLGEW